MSLLFFKRCLHCGGGQDIEACENFHKLFHERWQRLVGVKALVLALDERLRFTYNVEAVGTVSHVGILDKYDADRQAIQVWLNVTVDYPMANGKMTAKQFSLYFSTPKASRDDLLAQAEKRLKFGQPIQRGFILVDPAYPDFVEQARRIPCFLP